MNDYTLSKESEEELKNVEELRLEAYLCQGRVWTFGYGNTYYIHKKSGARIPVKQGDKLKNKEEADEVFRDVIGEFEQLVKSAIKVTLTQAQFDTLVSFAYNTGTVGRGLANAINTGRVNAIPSKFIEWLGVPKTPRTKFKNAEDKRNYLNNEGSLEPSEGLYNRRDLEIRKFMGWGKNHLI